jgi:hypothetical protein
MRFSGEPRRSFLNLTTLHDGGRQRMNARRARPARTRVRRRSRIELRPLLMQRVPESIRLPSPPGGALPPPPGVAHFDVRRRQ